MALGVLKWFKCDNVKLFNLGVSNSQEEVEFSIPETQYGALSAGFAHIGTRSNKFDEAAGYDFDHHRRVVTKVVDLDNFLLPKMDRLDFVKIDIEGAEMWAFQGMQQMLKKFKPVVLCEFSPRLLEGFNVDPIVWTQSLREKYTYDIFLYELDKQKLRLQTQDALAASNYIFVPKSRTNEFSTVIARKEDEI